MKQIIHLFSIATLLCLSSVASAQYFVVGGIAYNVLSTTEHTVEVAGKSTSYRGSINIPSTVTYGGTSYDVVALGEYAFYWSNLTSITIPSSVTQIKYACFLFSSGLTTFIVSSSVTNIERLALAANDITAINVAEDNPQYRSIDGILFSKDTSTLFACPIGKSGTVDLPQNTRNIAPYAFSYCVSLTNVSLHEGLSTIGFAAFLYNQLLNNIIIPSSVSYIGENPFAGCTSLDNLSIANGNTRYYMDGMMIYSMGGDTLLSCHKSDDSLFLPATLHAVGGFVGNRDIRYVHLPDDATTILENAFENSSLVGIDMPNQMALIDEYAFYGCNSLTHVGMPSSLVKMGKGCFGDCTNLTSIAIPNGLHTIPNSAFYGSESLSHITWGDAVAVIDSFAFGGSAFTELQLPATLRAIRCGGFNGYYDGTIRRVVFSAPVDTIEMEAFYGQPMESLWLKNSVPPVATTYEGLYGPLDDADIDSIIVPCGSLNAYLADSYWRKFADIYYEDCNEIDATTDGELSLYPNPATNRITIRNALGGHLVELVNMLGQTVLSQEIDGNAIEINVNGLDRGIYFLRLHTPNGTVTKRVILQ